MCLVCLVCVNMFVLVNKSPEDQDLVPNCLLSHYAHTYAHTHTHSAISLIDNCDVKVEYKKSYAECIRARPFASPLLLHSHVWIVYYLFDVYCNCVVLVLGS